ncbi:TonB-dependent receptor [Thauera sp.]|uniref:TonB-dependent receptor n=1 Tax=Thauera sp. TaxID=1905334 RepID=UPI001B47A3A9|nr:TonB-dependent receptor [Thauera sp.]MBP6131675.1 TonB-dependent receptor [Thauera sp.]MBP7047161.1 TonB-dependent receptor [Thauera sp.]HMV93155.1 TonB-dependent receptor [Thauera aminoaromatica]HNE99559.1 TonB-dependent receptor [Thauera aminoaromatica]
MRKRDTTLSTDQKALAINLDKYKYGSIVEIGAGQEVARRFFHVGAAAGTIAKTMSAYDMAVSDDIYGHVDRYVSRARLLQMLDKEFTQVVARLAHVRPKNTTFFAYAATVTARSFKQKNECHGWVGIRLQLHPGAAPSDVVMHVRMLDNDNALQSEALGILGVNLIHGAFFHHDQPEWVVEGLADGLGSERIEVDLIHFSGPYFDEVENRLMNLHLIRSWLTRAVVFNPQGEVVVPGELLYRRPVMVMRGSFKPVTLVNVDMMAAGLRQFSQLAAVDDKEIVSLAEITMNSLISGDNVDGADFLARIDLLASQGYTVMISDYVRFFRLRAYLRRYTQKPIGIVLSVRDFAFLFDEKYYEGLEGGILEAFGKLFPDNTHVYVYPSRPRGTDASATVTLDNVAVPANLRHLLAHLKENDKLVAVQPHDDTHLHIDIGEVLTGLRRGRGEWETDVPEAVAQRIIEGRLLGYDTE